MALDVNGREQDDNSDAEAHKGKSSGDMAAPRDENEEEEDDEDEEDEEPRLKYASLTKSQGPVYRNGDAASTFLVAGDKMIIGTHNGNIHVLALPSFQSLRVYHAHSASISAVSISPFPPPLPSGKPEGVNRLATEPRGSPVRTSPYVNAASPVTKSPRQQPPVPAIPSNSIYIATSSIDGNICVSSLVDPKDVLLRSFGRPVQAVALSPEYRSDRSYLSGGLAGNLILTVGGRPGTTSTSTTTGGAAATASGWLGTIGLGVHNGTDTVLHSGEGIVSAIKWSLSGRFVVWVNEHGIKIVRSSLHLEAAESDSAWKGISHIDRPSLPGWEEMAGLWKARAEWINEDGLEADDDGWSSGLTRQEVKTDTASIASIDLRSLRGAPKVKPIEKLVVGWGGTIWIINVHPSSRGTGKEVGERRKWHVEIVTILRTDCIISGVSLYTPNLLIVLAYITPDESRKDQNNFSQQGTPKKGVHRRQNALQPEMRIIDIATKEEVCMGDTLNVSRFESLSATDYHLGILPVNRSSTKVVTQRGALEVMNTIGGGIWDATMYPTRLFNSSASVRSAGSNSDKPAGSKIGSFSTTDAHATPSEAQAPHPNILTRGMKVFIQSPYDCVLATKPTISDHLMWLETGEKHEEAWKLLDSHPEAVSGIPDGGSDSSPSTPTKTQGSLVDFFADDSSQGTLSGSRNIHSQAEKEKRRIGEKWLQQLVNDHEWARAGQVAGQVLGTSSRWEHWVWVFAEADKYKEITPYIPTTQLRPPLPSLVYEVILGHYISRDRLQLKAAMERWPPELYDVSSIISAIESKLKFGDIRPDTVENGETGRDWQILKQSLAKLHLADGRARDALRCYIELQDPDAAMGLIRDYHIVDAVSDDIAGLILLRISPDQQKSAPLSELEELSDEPIRLLAEEAHHGTVRPDTVVSQLENRPGMRPYLFFYFRALWNGDTATSPSSPAVHLATPKSMNLVATEGKSLVNDHADLAVSLFAKYNRPLLLSFLKSSQSYTLETASAICERQQYIPELVYLLAKEGRTKRALGVIIDKLGDVSQAIAFAKEQDDPDLWNDLLDYSMNKPSFIRGLLEEVGTAINPITLVRRIPEGLEIEGLREGLSRMIREYELQDSISEGVARVLRGEVTMGMNTLRTGQKRGIKFEPVHLAKLGTRHSDLMGQGDDGVKKRPEVVKPGCCSGCGEAFLDDEKSPILAFPCAHTFHLSCLLTYSDPDTLSSAQKTPQVAPPSLTAFPPLDDDPTSAGGERDRGRDHSVGGKIRHAALLKGRVGGGCPVSVHKGG